MFSQKPVILFSLDIETELSFTRYYTCTSSYEFYFLDVAIFIFPGLVESMLALGDIGVVTARCVIGARIE